MRRKDVYFFERQRFRQWWFWAIMMGLSLFFIIGSVQQIVFNQPFGDKPMSDVGLIITTGLVLLLTISLLSGSLKTFINKEGIYIQFAPFHFRYKFYDWNEVDSVRVEQYKPIREFGGWGIRKGKKGVIAYTVSGKTGLVLLFKDGKKVVIGTRLPDYLSKALIELGKMEHNNDG